MNIKKYVSGLIALTTLATLAIAVPVFADNTTAPANPPANGMWGNGMGRGMNHGNRAMMKPGVFGTVSAVSGNTITVAGKQGFGASAVATTFTVDATNAKIMKNNVAGTVSSIVVGDTVMAQGTLTGTNLVATMIRDGQPKFGMGMRGSPNGAQSGKTPLASPINGNGQPVVAGTVSVINGSTLTITNKSNVTYTVDASNAKVTGVNITSLSNVSVGDMVIVQGTVNGNAVVATSVIDQAKPNSTTNASGTANPAPHRGFLGGIGAFFGHIFGF